MNPSSLNINFFCGFNSIIVLFIYSNSFNPPPHIKDLYFEDLLYNSSKVELFGYISSESKNDIYFPLLILIPLFLAIPEPLFF